MLGSGGMATVFLAEDLKHHRLVAVKVLRPELTAGVGPERFLREIEVAVHLQHPHILPLFDSGNSPTAPGFSTPPSQARSRIISLGRPRWSLAATHTPIQALCLRVG
jgi:serine/threonine protein kinase